jgi:hypothetical protein
MQSPGKCFIATEEGKLLGFACYDASAKYIKNGEPENSIYSNLIFMK